VWQGHHADPDPPSDVHLHLPHLHLPHLHLDPHSPHLRGLLASEWRWVQV